MPYRPPLVPLAADEPVTDWSAVPGGRDGFVLMLSNVIDACDRNGYSSPFDGAQIAGWLESPDRDDRRRASYHLALLRQSMEDVARRAPSGGVS